jgi:hypothetical protein
MILYLCVFAFLSSSSRGLFASSTAQTALRAVLPLTPPAPYAPSQSPGGEGEPSGLGSERLLTRQSLGVEGRKRFGGFRRVGGAGFAAQPTIEHGVIV